MIAFLIWVVCGVVFIGWGISAFRSRSTKAAGFWANAEMFEVNDVKAYNRAVGKLFIGFGVIFIALGIPLLAGENSPYILISTIGVMLESILLMVIYVVVIEKKYRSRK